MLSRMLALLLATTLASPPPQVVYWRDAIDWREAEVEATALLAEYVTIDTVNPPGNEARGAEFIARALEADGIPSRRLTVAPGRDSLIARLSGSGDLPPLCLLSHIDVVPAEEKRWEHAPLAGEVVDGYLYGRGVLDMKGMGVLELQVMRWLARLRVPLLRDVILLAVADEEVDNLGMQQVVEQWEDIGCSHLINEGGLGIRDALFDGQAIHAISTAEKGVLWVDMIATGPAGHGSTEDAGEAPGRLLDAMTAVQRRRTRPSISPEMYALLREVGAHRGGVVGWVLRHRWSVNLLARRKLLAEPATRAAITDTLHLTGMMGAQSHNVVPSEVRAHYDSRMLPGTRGEDILAELEHLTRRVDGIAFEVVHERESNGSPADDPLFDALARYAVEDRPYAVAGPLLSVGFTDSIYARPLGVHAYGYVPFEVTAEEANTMHGHNERVSTENLREGLRRLFSTVLEVSVAPTALSPAVPAEDEGGQPATERLIGGE